MKRLFSLLFFFIGLFLWMVMGSSCASLPDERQGASEESILNYYWQAIKGHLALLNSSEPIEAWLQRPETPPPLQQKLKLAQAIRTFASYQLGLPDNHSYTRYADLGRKAVVWNVIAAPEFSLELKQWCYFIVGCASYRGYYHLDHAQAYARWLKNNHHDLETAIIPVPAYSTLGKLNWLGGDPILSTFIGYPEAELARLMFHELAHQVVYIPDDTTFNESFASSVEQIGLKQWLPTQPNDFQITYQIYDQRRQSFKQLNLSIRQAYEKLYLQSIHQNMDQDALRQAKIQLRHETLQQYEAWKTQWHHFKGYDEWMNQLSNPLLGLSQTYDQWIPAFEHLFILKNKEWSLFYQAVHQLAAQPRLERDACLKELASSQMCASLKF